MLSLKPGNIVIKRNDCVDPLNYVQNNETIYEGNVIRFITFDNKAFFHPCGNALISLV